MNRVIATLLSGVVLSTLIATSAIAQDNQSAQMPIVSRPTPSELDRIYVEKYGS